MPRRLPRPERPPSRSLSLLSSHLWFSPVEHLEEFRYSVPHPRVHVRFRAFNVVMEVIAEELDTVDCRQCLSRVGKVSRGKD